MNVLPHFAMLAALAGAALPASAQEVPLLIQCQGRLSDGTQPLNGEMQMILRLYDQAQGGTLRYEDSANVRLSDGMYTTYLGDDTTKGSLKEALSSGPLWLEVIANGTVFTPRERMAAVPFAVMAEGVRKGAVDGNGLAPQAVRNEHLTKGSVGLDALMDNSVNSGRIVDGSIGEVDLADRSVTPPKLSMSYWTTKGNLNEGGEMIFLGTLDARPVDFRVNNKRALRLEPNPVSPIVVGGHEVNDAGKNAAGAVIGGGGQPNQPNKAEGEFSVVDGGADNLAKGAFSVVGGGLGNQALGNRSAVGGGRANKSEGPGSLIGGGFSNRVTNSFASIGGGHANLASGYVSTISGGWGNTATGVVAVVSGGQENRALGDASAIAGGWNNLASGYGTTVAGGRGNRAEGAFASVGGGTNNVASGLFAAIPGGRENQALGEASFAAGARARAAHNGAFVWADGGKGSFASTGDNQFLIRAAGNVGIDTDKPDQKLTVNGAVKAKSFLGDGSALTGITASTLADGAVGDAQIRADAGIAPAKIAGGALTAKTVFGGALEGTADNLALKKGSVGRDHLAPGLLALAIADSDLSREMKTLREESAKLQGTLLTKSLRLGGDVTGGVDKVELLPGVVGEAELAPGLLQKAIASSELARAVGVLGTTRMPLNQAFAGDVAGTATNLQIRAGAIGPEELMPGLLQSAIASSDLSAGLVRFQEQTKAEFARKSDLELIKEALGTVAPKADLAPLQAALPGLATKAELAPITTTLSNLVTRAELDPLQKSLATFASKADLDAVKGPLATLGTFSTKADLESLQKSLGGYATKGDLEPIQKTLATLPSQADLAPLKGSLETLKTFATKAEIEAVRKDIPVITGLATQAELAALQKALAELPARAELEPIKGSLATLGTFATKEDLETLVKKIAALSQAERDSVRGTLATLASKEEMIAVQKAIPAATAGLASKEELGNLQKSIPTTTNLVSKAELAALQKAAATKEELAALQKSLPSVVGLASKEELAALQKAMPSTANLASKEELTALQKASATKEELASLQKSLPSVAGLASKEDLATVQKSIPAVGNLATKEDVGALQKALPTLASKQEAQAIAKELADTDAARRRDLELLNTRLKDLGSARDLVIGGVVTGKTGAVAFRDGVVEARHLAPGIWDDLKSTQSLLTEAIATLTKQSLSLGTPLGGEVAGTPSNVQLKTGVVTADKIANGSVTLAKLGPDAVAALQNANAVPDASVTLAKLAPDTAAALKNASTVADGSITPAKLAPELTAALVPFKLADGSVSAAKLAPDLLARLDKPTLADGSVGLAKLSPEVVQAIQAPAPAPAKGSITGAQLANGAVTAEKLDPSVFERLSQPAGPGNEASGLASAVGGGTGNKATGKYAAIPGGMGNLASGDYALAAGRRAKAQHEGALVFADSTDADFASTARNQFLIRAAGNVGIDVNNPSEKLTVGGNVAPGTTSTHNLGAADKRWRSLYLDNLVSYREVLTLSSGDVPRFQIDATGGVTFAGLRTLADKESPSLIGGHAGNRLAPGVSGATISGGGNADHPNEVAADFGTVGGGFGNKVTGFDGTIGGGQDNVAGGTAPAIGGGFLNTASGLFPAIAGGAANQALANLSAIAGGFSNKVTGAYSAIPGGYQNEANGDYAFAAGRRAKAGHSGSFVWADSINAAFGSTEGNQFAVRATGGVYFYTSPELASGVKLNAGSGSWSMLSDRNAKENLQAVDGRATLEKLAALPVYNWNYKTQDDSVKHVGPTSQDFSGAFGVGEDGSHISAVDADGVALSAIQGLYAIVKEKDEAIRKLEDQNQRLQDRLEAIEKKLGATP